MGEVNSPDVFITVSSIYENSNKTTDRRIGRRLGRPTHVVRRLLDDPRVGVKVERFCTYRIVDECEIPKLRQALDGRQRPATTKK